MAFNDKISFIGAGRMAESIIHGIIKKKLFPPKKIYISDKDAARIKHLAGNYGVNAAEDNIKAVHLSGLVMLCVKPQAMSQVLGQISGAVESGQLFISIAAGIPISVIEKSLSGAGVVRVMPNTPCLIGEGMTVIAKGTKATDTDMKTAGKIFSALGKVKVLEEKYFDAVTALSGSGPAFVYRMLEGLIEGGMESGLSREAALELTEQTALGAVKTLIETRKTPKELTDMVASPGGTTIEGLKVFDASGLNRIIAGAVNAAAKRSSELRDQFEKARS